MEVTNATATLAEPGRFDVGGGGVTTVVPRDEIEEALETEESPELVLEVARGGDGGPSERRTISVSWDRDELARLLEQTGGERVALTFDRAALERALEEPEVEGHGLRERALILTVAAATAVGATAGAASAYPVSSAGQPMTTQVGEAPIGGAVGAAGDESPASVTGGAGAVGSAGGAVGASGTVSPAESTGGAGAGVLETTGGAVGAAGTETPAQSTGGAGIVVSEPSGGGSGFDVPTPDPGTAALAGLAGLGAVAITAAGFATRRRGTPRPA